MLQIKNLEECGPFGGINRRRYDEIWGDKLIYMIFVLLLLSVKLRYDKASFTAKDLNATPTFLFKRLIILCKLT